MDPQALELAGPYVPREITPLGTIEAGDWRFKLYGIHAPERPAPDSGWEPTVRELARRSFVLIDWWVGENMLENHVHVFVSGERDADERVTATGLSACVWEQRVVAFEREAWIETVLANPGGPDLGAYLERRLEGRF